MFSLKKAVLLALLSSCFLAKMDKPALALCGCAAVPYPCTTFMDMDPWWMAQDFTQTQKDYLLNEFYQNHMVDELWKENIEPALKAMTAQLIGARVHMTGAIGGFLDGQSANETQLTMQRLQAEALRDYTPGENLCRFGTTVRALGASQQKTESVLYALDEMAEDRLMNTRGANANNGSDGDEVARFMRFARTYCNPGDNNGMMKQLCYPNVADPVSKSERFNKDIDLARTLDAPLTLDLNFTDSNLTPDEEDVIALGNNLYAHKTFSDLPDSVFKNTPGDPNKPLYLDLRQVAALRSVAVHSYNTLAAQKARGAAGSANFLSNVLKELGMDEKEVKAYLDSGTGEPSYNAQMEILTKKIYQNPNFYVNLIDKPANVKRQFAAMTAIGLTQDRDLFESLQRQELLLSLMLELEVRQEQRNLEVAKNNSRLK